TTFSTGTSISLINLGANTVIEDLQFCSNFLNINEIQALAAAICENKTLTALKLRDAARGEELNVLAKSRPWQGKITYLGLTDNKSIPKAAPKHESLWKDKYDKAREYLSKLIGDKNAEKELLDCADNYVVENSTKKVIKDKKRNAVA
ncbi:8197_t:CDS:2, partial [Gigaspora rosea]